MYIPEILLFVCNSDFELQYQIRIKTKRTAIATRIFLDLMVTNWLKPSERLICATNKLKDVVFALQILSARYFDLTEIISRDHIVAIEIKDQFMSCKT